MSESLSNRHSQILDDHRRLGLVLHELENCEQAAEICSQAESLVPWLKRHFAEEEEPAGVFESIERHDPRHSHEIGILVGEHQAMLDQVDALANMARSVKDEPGLNPELSESVRAFILALRLHERKENRLLTDAFYHEEGGGD